MPSNRSYQFRNHVVSISPAINKNWGKSQSKATCFPQMLSIPHIPAICHNSIGSDRLRCCRQRCCRNRRFPARWLQTFELQKGPNNSSPSSHPKKNNFLQRLKRKIWDWTQVHKRILACVRHDLHAGNAFKLSNCQPDRQLVRIDSDDCLFMLGGGW